MKFYAGIYNDKLTSKVIRYTEKARGHYHYAGVDYISWDFDPDDTFLTLVVPEVLVEYGD